MRLLLLSLLGLVAACSATAPLKAVNATGDAVTFEFDNGGAAEAARQASLYCANLGRNASLRDVTPKGDDRSIAVFDCR
ncbi:MAG TPA: hypothetical protein VF502_04520 [Stellaceae bacterium]